MKRKPLLNTERIVALFCLALSAWIFYEASTFKGSALDSIGPALYPRLVASIIGICSIALFIKERPKEEETSSPAPEGAKPDGKVSDYRSLVIVVCALIVYSLFLKRLGFILCTILFLFSLSIYLDQRELKEKLKTAIGFSVGMSVCLYLFFAKVLGVLLPTLGLIH